MSHCLTQLVLRANAEMRAAHEKLEIEESGREVAALQGKIAGTKEFLRDLAEVFDLPMAYLEDEGQKPDDLLEYELDAIELINVDVSAVRTSSNWERLLEKLHARTEALKYYLLEVAEKSRDLDLVQNKHKAHFAFETFFRDVE
jgi:hypothetical protein